MNYSIDFGDTVSWRAEIALVIGLIEQVHSLIPLEAQQEERLSNCLADLWDWQNLVWKEDERELSEEEVAALPSLVLYQNYINLFIEESSKHDDESFANYAWNLMLGCFGFIIGRVEACEYVHNTLKPTTVDSFVIEIRYHDVDQFMAQTLDTMEDPNSITSWLTTAKEKLIAAHPYNPEDRMGRSVLSLL